VVVQGLMLEAEMVVMTALVGRMVLKPELMVGVEALGRMDVDVELGGGSAMVILLQLLQHMRWYSGRGQ